MHGFENLSKNGLLQLHLTEADGLITVTIRDNGIGRKAAAALRSASPHRSVAMSNTKARLELLKAAYQEGDFEVVVRDLEEGGEAMGQRWLFGFREICIEK